ncbi:MAG: hypothetical protein J6P31_07000 [Oscillospiraceae bacterium]|nr:hypothetical protein [Oscillospiraceae bacterium]
MAIKRSVSLYSYQQAYYLGQLDLEGCVAAAAAAGAKGIELIPEQMPVGRFPNPWKQDVVWWKELMDKYGTTPTCMDTFIDFKMFERKRYITLQEQVAFLERDLRLAAELGFPVIRVLCKIHFDVLEAALPIAEYYGVKMGTEIHPPVMIDSPYIDGFVDMIERNHTQWAALIPDFGIFARCSCKAAVEQQIRGGFSPEAAWLIHDQVAAGRPTQETVQLLTEMGAAPREIAAARQMGGLPTYNDPEKLLPLMDYVCHFHGKCYELDEDCNESTIDYPGVIATLKKADWDGWISTEYEGQRLFHDEACPTIADEVEQVRRHQELLRRLIGE